MGATGATSADDQDPRGWLLRSNAAFRRLWLSRMVSSFGDSLSLVALTLFVADSAGAAFAVAALLLVGDFAPALLGPLAGAVADRFDRRRVLLVSEIIQAGGRPAGTAAQGGDAHTVFLVFRDDDER